jgi:hypothetical protein
MQGKDLEKTGRDLSEAISRPFSGETEKTTKHPVRIARISAGIQFPHESLERYFYSNLFGLQHILYTTC